MRASAPQITLSWATPRLTNVRLFRKALGGSIKALVDDTTPYGWLFHDQDSHAVPGEKSLSRFFSGENQNGSFVGVTVLGDLNCERLTGGLLKIMPAARNTGLVDELSVQDNVVWIKPDDVPQVFRMTNIALRKLKGDVQQYYDEPALMLPHIHTAVLKGINEQSAALDLGIRLEADDVKVLSVGAIGSQPIFSENGEGMTTRVRECQISLPCRLQGSWAVGGLLSYGNGRLTPVLAERHYHRPPNNPSAFPRWRMADRDRQKADGNGTQADIANSLDLVRRVPA